MKTVREIFKHQPRTGGTRPKRGVVDEATYRQVQAEFLRKQGLTPHVERTPVAAYLNQDRLIIDCVCDNGVPVLRARERRDGNFAACVSCGAIYQSVDVQADIDAVDETLRYRPERNRNWDPRRGETLEDVERENRERGLPVPREDREREAAADGGGR